jgi:hypothetical protein
MTSKGCKKVPLGAGAGAVILIYGSVELEPNEISTVPQHCLFGTTFLCTPGTVYRWLLYHTILKKIPVIAFENEVSYIRITCRTVVLFSLYLAALLHEADDHKYFKSDSENARDILASVLQVCPTAFTYVELCLLSQKLTVSSNSVPFCL